MRTTETVGKPRFVTLPWGRAQVIDEVTFEREGPDGQPVSVGVAHLRQEDGAELVRFFYRSSGRILRGPLTLRPADRAGLKAALAEAPGLRRLVRELL